MRWLRLVLPATMALAFGLASQAATEEENAEDFMGIHKIEIIFHEAGTTKNLDLMLSLFADDATLTSGQRHFSYLEKWHPLIHTPIHDRLRKAIVEAPAPGCLIVSLIRGRC